MPRQSKEFMLSEQVQNNRKVAVERWKQLGGFELSKQKRQEGINQAKISLPGEEWKLYKIEKIQTDVLVSNMGRIKSTGRIACIYSTRAGAHGLKVRIHGHKFLVHHLVAQAWLGSTGKGLKFKDGNRHNPILSNLQVPVKEVATYTTYNNPNTDYYKFEVYVPEKKTYYKKVSILMQDMGLPNTQYMRQKIIDVKLGKAPQQRLDFTPLKVEKTNLIVAYINRYCYVANTTGLPGFGMPIRALEQAKEKESYILYNVMNEQLKETATGAEYHFEINDIKYCAYLTFSKTIIWTKIIEIT